MAQKEFTFKGKRLDELKELSIQDFAKLLTARKRRSITRGFTNQQKILLKKIEKANAGQRKKPIKTHCRDMVIIPKMVGLLILVHQGKEFTQVQITEEMLGHVLGEFTQTRKKITHSAPGIGATRSSAAASVK